MATEVEEVTKRLDALIAILLSRLPKPQEPSSLRDQMELLDQAGLGPADIARILQRPSKPLAPSSPACGPVQGVVRAQKPSEVRDESRGAGFPYDSSS